MAAQPEMPPSNTTMSPQDSELIKGRLPATVKPLHYTLELEPDLDPSKLTFKGKVTVDLIVLQDTDKLVLHSLDLRLGDITLKPQTGAAVRPASVKFNKSDETVTLTFPRTFKAKSSVLLSIKYSGVLNDQFDGLYKAQYTKRNGEVGYAAVTQFQSTFARQALPCWDEPALKATFDVTLIADEGLTCLSNMDFKSEDSIKSADGKHKKAVTFNTTPPMSSYLLAVAVGEFDFVESKDFRIPVKVYSTPDVDVKRQGQYAADMTSKYFKLYEDSFGIEYPLPKIDCIALADKQGAMENWGLITYQHSAIIQDQDLTSSRGKLQVAEVVAHEEGHQWFGDIVTMEWWEGLWLNESFATWSSWFAVNHFYPSWHIWQGEFVSAILQTALALDSLPSSHPIEVPVETSDEIIEVFDPISYQKGGSVLQMLASFLGQDIFLKGVAHYLKAHAFANTKTTDLWKALGDVSGKNVEDYMAVWTRNMGHPIITVTEDAETNKLNIKQNRYLRSGKPNKEEDEVIWPVFLALQTETDTHNDLVLNTREAEISLNNLNFYKLNHGHHGVYRVLYPPARLHKLIESVKRRTLSLADSTGLLYDSISLSQSLHQSVADTFDLAKALSRAANLYSWRAVMAWFTALHATWVVAPKHLRDAIDAAQLSFSAQYAHKIDWDHWTNVDVIKGQFRALLFSAAGTAGDTTIIKIAKEKFADFTAGDRDAIPADLRLPVFSIVIKHGGEAEYNAILSEFDHGARIAEQKGSAIAALGQARSPDLIARTIALALEPDRIPRIYVRTLLSGLNSHEAGISALLDTITNHFDDIEKRFKGGLGTFGIVLGGFCGGLCTYEHADRLEEFFEDRDTKHFQRTLSQTLEEIRIKARWRKEATPVLCDWLEEHGYM